MYYYISNFKRPITSHHSYHVTIQYPMVLYSCYWMVVIVQLSAVDLPCKVNDKSLRMRFWFIMFDRLQTEYKRKYTNYYKQYNYLRPSYSVD